LTKKAVIDKKIAELSAKAVDLAKQRDKKAGTIGNIVDKDSAISLTEVSTGAGTDAGMETEKTEKAGRGVDSRLTTGARMTTRHLLSGTRNRTTRGTAHRDCRSRTRPRGSSRTTRCSRG
jgi:hypothetical protein